MHHFPHLLSRWLPAVLALGLLGLAALYLAMGLLLYFELPLRARYKLPSRWEYAAPVDLQLRWVECQYVRRGIDPIRVARGELPPLMEFATPQRIREDGVPVVGSVTGPIGYTPWSYTIGFLLIAAWGSLSQSLYVFGALNLLAWLALLLCGWSAATSCGLRGFPRLCVALAAVAQAGVIWVLQVGNYGLVVAALLALAMRCLQRDRPKLAGALLGLAMVKPQIAALFFLIPLVRRQYSAVLIGAGVVAIAWLAASWQLNESPLTLLAEMFGLANSYRMFHGLLHVLILAGVEIPMINRIGIYGGGFITFVLLLGLRKQSVLELSAIAGTASILWTYHHWHDLILVQFLAVYLLAAHFQSVGWRQRAFFLVAAVPPLIPLLTPIIMSAARLWLIHLLWLVTLIAGLIASRGLTLDRPATPPPR